MSWPPTVPAGARSRNTTPAGDLHATDHTQVHAALTDVVARSPWVAGITADGLVDDRGPLAASTAQDVTLGPGVHRVGSNLTLTGHCRFLKGAKLKPDSGVTITINGSVDAGFYQIFDYSAGGKVRTTLAKFPQAVYAEWWGADQTGATDSTLAGQQAADFVTGDAATSTTRNALAPTRWGPGTFLLSGAGVNYTSVLGLDFRGAGKKLTTFKPSGVMASVLDFNGVSRGHIGDFSIVGDNTETVTTAIRVRYVTGIGRTTNFTKVEGITIDANTRYVNGIQLGEPGSSLQCDTVHLHDVTISGQWTVGEATYWQSGLIVGSNLSANNLDHKGYGVNITANRYNFDIQASQFACFGFESMASEADIRIGATQTSYLTFQGGRCEGSGRLLYQSGSGSAPTHVSLADIDWRPNAINADGRWIWFVNGGSLNLKGLRCFHGTMPTATIYAPVAVNRHLTITADGLQVGMALTFGVNLAFDLSAQAHVEGRGYTQLNASGQDIAGAASFTSKSQTYAATNVTVDRTYDADTVLVAELADVVGTLIADLRAQGVVK